MAQERSERSESAAADMSAATPQERIMNTSNILLDAMAIVLVANGLRVFWLSWRKRDTNGTEDMLGLLAAMIFLATGIILKALALLAKAITTAIILSAFAR